MPYPRKIRLIVSDFVESIQSFSKTFDIYYHLYYKNWTRIDSKIFSNFFQPACPAFQNNAKNSWYSKINGDSFYCDKLDYADRSRWALTSTHLSRAFVKRSNYTLHYAPGDFIIFHAPTMFFLENTILYGIEPVRSIIILNFCELHSVTR